MAHVQDELDRQGFIQSEVLAKLEARSGIGLLAKGCDAWIARNDTGQDEHHCDHAEQHRDAQEQATDDEADHWRSFLPGVRLNRRGAPAMRPAPLALLGLECEDYSSHTGWPSIPHGAGGLRKPPHRPGQYEKMLFAPLWSGERASHWAASETITSWAVKSEPSWYLTPSRRVQVHTVSSSFDVQPVASSGTGALPFSSKP